MDRQSEPTISAPSIATVRHSDSVKLTGIRRRMLPSTRGGVTHAPRLWKVWIAAPVAITVASALGWFLYQRVLVSPAVHGAAPIEVVKTTLALMAALGAVLTGVYAYRKQRLSEGDAARADADQLTQRYSTAAEQLGHNKAAVRLAGVYAMARLADEWPKQRLPVLFRGRGDPGKHEARQQCIDVLCAYLRMPADPDAGGGESQVRATIVRTIAGHLHDHSASSWQEHDFDFRGATLHDADFGGTRFSGETTDFGGTTFSAETTTFDRATFSAETTTFDRATFSAEFTTFDRATFSGKRTHFEGATFSGKKTNFGGTTFSGKYTTFLGATFSAENTTFDRAKFSGETTDFGRTTFSGEYTQFGGTTFSAKYTTFLKATFSAKYTTFDRATFSGSTTADTATGQASFLGSRVDWGPISPRTLPSPAAGTV